GLDRAREMVQTIRDRTQIPIVIDLEAHFEALRALGASKIVIATPYVESRTEERKKLCEKVGFEVLATTSLGLEARTKIQELSPWVAYHLAKEAYRQAPEAEAIYLSCPEWPHVNVIEMIEQDTGRPVVYPYGALVWKWCHVLHVKETIVGYGKLLEMVPANPNV
ncbi:MAG: hypothetical protein HY670_01095, partial [Chloroflexi bacterium]|nr:hypothetical protein [Chloroflexota bacterium]